MKNPKSTEKYLNLPEGKFFAKWSGYTVNLLLPEWEEFNIKMDQGIRGVNMKCEVEVKDGIVEILEGE
jgi:hypothetical protein